MQASPEEREQLAMAFHVIIAHALGMEESVVAAVDMRSGLCGTYSWQHDLLAINARDLHKQPMTLEEAKGQLRLLASLPLEERKKVAGLPPERAVHMPHGLCILIAAMELCGYEEMTVSGKNNLDGYLLTQE